MNTIRTYARVSAQLVVCLIVLSLPSLAVAQQVTPGAARVQMSDVTGPNVSSLILFETGTAKTFACPVAWGVRTEADVLSSQLRAGTLEVETPAGIRAIPSQQAQQLMLEVMSSSTRSNSAEQSAIAALSSMSAGRNAGAADLVRSISGLLAAANVMDPLKPGYRTATQLAHAVHVFNQFVGTADAASLAAPQDVFLVTEAVLSRLVIAGLENDGRAVDQASRRGDYGLACAPLPRPTALPAPPPVVERAPLERAIELCVLEAGRIEFVAAIAIPETGDTLALRNGERLPFATVHPDTGHAGEMPWLKSGEAIKVGRASYTPYGARLTVTPSDAVTAVGSFGGVPVFAYQGSGSTPKVVLVPIAARCVMQPYQLLEEVRKAR